MASAIIEIPSRRAQTPTVYDERFFELIDRDGLASAKVIVPLVRDLIAFDSVVDVGCGHGAWLRVFQNHGASRIVGYDGGYVDVKNLLIPDKCFLPVDLSHPFDVCGRFDLAVCLEVAEHLPLSMAQPLVNTLCEAAPIVLFSAAIPGQGGTHHINEQWPAFWQSLFANHSFRRLDPIRWAVWQNPDVSSCYKQNIYVFASDSAIRNNILLKEQLALGKMCPFELVHQDVLSPYTSLRGLLKSLPRAARHAISRLMGGKRNTRPAS